MYVVIRLETNDRVSVDNQSQVFNVRELCSMFIAGFATENQQLSLTQKKKDEL